MRAALRRSELPVPKFVAFGHSLTDCGTSGSTHGLQWSPEPGKILEWVGEALDVTAKTMGKFGVRQGRESRRPSRQGYISG